jgi:hypothetical protein
MPYLEEGGGRAACLSGGRVRRLEGLLGCVSHHGHQQSNIPAQVTQEPSPRGGHHQSRQWGQVIRQQVKVGRDQQRGREEGKGEVGGRGRVFREVGSIQQGKRTRKMLSYSTAGQDEGCRWWKDNSGVRLEVGMGRLPSLL